MKALYQLILITQLLTPCFAQQKNWIVGSNIGLGLTLDVGNKSSPINYNNTTPLLYSAFVSRKIWKGFEAEVGFGFYQKKVSTPVIEIFRLSNFTSTSTYRVFMFSLEAKYVMLNKNRFSLYSYTGIIGEKSLSIINTTPIDPLGAEVNTTKHSSPFTPFAFFNFGAGCNYFIYSNLLITANLNFLYHNNASVTISKSDFTFMPELGLGYRF